MTVTVRFIPLTASAPGRMESIYEKLHGRFEFVEPRSASEEDILLVHSQSHIDYVRASLLTYEIALLVAGGAIKAAEIAMRGESLFSLIRPPGHHTSPGSSWGHYYFHPEGSDRQAYLDDLLRFLSAAHKPFDILALSAGFDRHEQD